MKLNLIASHDCTPVPGAAPGLWEASLGDPQFLFEVGASRLPAGMAELTLYSDPSSPAWTVPQIYFDIGDGFRGSLMDPLSLDRKPGSHELTATISIPAGTRAIRVDPTSDVGTFSLLPRCKLTRRPVYLSALKRLWVVFTEEGLPGIARRVLSQDGLDRAKRLTAERVEQIESRAEVGFRQTLVDQLTGRHEEYIGAPAASAPPASDVKMFAFYLPQFHPIAENDAWWGPGFTEWTNVSKAIPRFPGHHQPHLPGELGFYDLRVPGVMRRQVELAKLHGIAGFCFYYYWFSGKRLLESPLDHFLDSPDLDSEFCVCWANENWSRRWDGSESDVLMAQAHSPEDDVAMIDDLIRMFQDKRYMRIDGKPVLVVYRVGILPEARETALRWRLRCRERGIGEIYLVAAQTFGMTDPAVYGFDAAMEFPPHGVHAQEIQAVIEPFAGDFNGKVYSYAETAENQSRALKRDYVLHRTAMSSWDNTARKGANGNVFLDARPSVFQSWLRALILQARAENQPGHRLVFINAWNEWAEGTHLEPDRYFGYANLMACHKAISSTNPLARARVSVVMPVYNHEKYVRGAIASVLQQTVQDIELIVIDDCSKDRSLEEARQAIADYDTRGRATLIKMPINHDAYNVINFGISQARGEYIAIINSDDLWPAERLDNVIAAMESAGSELGFARVRLIDSDGAVLADDNELAKSIHDRQDRYRAAQSLPTLQLLRGNAAVTTGNLVFKHSLYDKTGPFAPLRLCHDWDFLLRSTYFTRPAYTDEQAYDYRVHETNTFRAVDHLAESDTMKVLSRFFAGFNEHPDREALLADEEFKRLLASEPYMSAWAALENATKNGRRTNESR